VTDLEIIEKLLAGEDPLSGPGSAAVQGGGGLVARVHGLRAMLGSLGEIRGGCGDLLTVHDSQRRRLHRLIRIMERGDGSRGSGWAERVVALLTFDSLRAPMAVGVRGDSGTRVVRFEAEGFGLDLMVTRGDGGEAACGVAARVAGEIRMTGALEQAVACEIDTDVETALCPDEDWLFSVVLVPGTYSFDISGDGRRFVTPPVDIAVE